MKRFILALLLASLLPGGAPATPQVGGPTSPDGTTAVQIDLPLELRLRNVGGSDGAGLCVYTSATMAARFQNETRLFGLRAYAEKRPGGSWPEKLQKDLQAVAPDAPVIQVTGCSLAFVRLCLDNGYLVSCTWGGNHMLNVVALTDRWACILDNNSPWGEAGGKKADTKLQWMTPAEYQRKAAMGGGIWIVVVLGKGPPPPAPYTEARPVGLEVGRWSAPRYTWRHYRDDPSRLYLFSPDGLQLGGWNAAEQYYRPFDAHSGRWEPVRPPPFAPPPLTKGEGVAGEVPAYGVVAERLPAGTAERFTLNGQVIDRATAERLVTRTRGLPSLTVVGDESLRKQVRADWQAAPALAPFRGRVIVQDYAPDSPLVTGVGLRPGLTLQAPPDARGRGKVLHRQSDYDGPEPLAQALRRADPGYDPSKDPDLRRPVAPPAQPVPGPTVETSLHPAAVPLGLAGVLAGLLLLPGRRKAVAPDPLHEMLR